MESILSRFCLDGSVTVCRRHGCGHIHDTYYVETDTGAQYILQRMNRHVFPHIDYVMENITAISDHLRQHGCGKREAVEVIHTEDGGSWLQDAGGSCWRVLGYIRDSLCLQNVEQPEEFYESGVAYGTFQHRLCDFPAETLHETIPDFHNTPARYQQLRDAAAENVKGRAAAVRRELEGYLALEERVSQLHRQRMARELPTRVTHNDTKLNNVLLDINTRKALCVIDLDTVMPGLAAYDFGDSIRFGASTAAEDETDLSRVSLDLALYRVFTEGFLSACPGLTRRSMTVFRSGRSR